MVDSPMVYTCRMGEWIFGLAMLYALLCAVPCLLAWALGAPHRHALYLWMLATGWNPLGWLGAALYIGLARANSPAR